MMMGDFGWTGCAFNDGATKDFSSQAMEAVQPKRCEGAALGNNWG
jgi:hypothetical protein